MSVHSVAWRRQMTDLIAGLEKKGTLKMRDRKIRDWKMRHQTAMVENAGLENGVTTFYGTPCIRPTYVCSVLQDATIEVCLKGAAVAPVPA